MKRTQFAGLLVLVALVGASVWWLQRTGIDARVASGDDAARAGGHARVAVEVSPVATAPVTDIREFTGTLVPSASYTVAPKVGGQVARVYVDIGDRVERGDLLVKLESRDAEQAVAAAEAALAVARAKLEQARANARLAEREFERVRTLARQDLVSQSQLDSARAQATAKRAAIEVAKARVAQREAALARARIGLDYTTLRADWPERGGPRVVGRRMVNPGDTVAANTPLLTILDLTPIVAVIRVPASGYGALAVGQQARITTAAYPGRVFTGRIARIAPRFDRQSRQARVEVVIENADRALKPGMFATVRVRVERIAEATVVPREALVRTDDTVGVFRVVEGQPPRVRFEPVTIGIRQGGRVQILEPELDGRVVTLGQQLLEDGAPILIAELPAA